MSYKATAWAYDMPLSAPMKPVLVVLSDMADEAGTCYPGQQKIAEMTGLSVRTVARALVKLEVLGLVERRRRMDAFGHRTSDRYFLKLSVSMPESLPDTLPTRQIAYKAHSPSLPVTNVIPTGQVGRGITSEPLENHQGGSRPAPWRCGNHQNAPAGGACSACGDARRQHDATTRDARAIEVSRPTVPGIVTEPDCPKHPHRPLRGCDRCAEDAVAS